MQFQFVRRASLESDDRVKIFVMLWKNSFTFLMKQSASVLPSYYYLFDGHCDAFCGLK